MTPLNLATIEEIKLSFPNYDDICEKLKRRGVAVVESEDSGE